MKTYDEEQYRYFLNYLRYVVRNRIIQQKEIAIRAKISQGYLSEIINQRKRTPAPEETQKAIAAALDLSLKEFVEKGKMVGENSLVSQPNGGYGVSQVNYFGQSVEGVPTEELVSLYPDIGNYMEMFRLAMRTRNKKLMLTVLEQLREVIDQMED